MSGNENCRVVAGVFGTSCHTGQWQNTSGYCGDAAIQLEVVFARTLNAAIACLALGDQNAYLRLRQEMNSRFKDPDEKTAERMLKVNVMRPFDDQTAVRMETLAAQLRRALLKQPTRNQTEYSQRLALYEYRRGNYLEAMDSARRSVANVPAVAQPNAMERVISAMSLRQNRNRSAAQLELERAKNLIETGFDLEFDMWHWRDWVIARLLLREAESLIQQTPLPTSGVAPR